MSAAAQVDPYASIAKPLPQASGGDPYASIAKDASAPTASEAPKPGLLDSVRSNVNAARQGAQPGDGIITGALKNFGAGGADVVHSLGHAIMNPRETLTPHMQTPEESAEASKPVTQQFGDSFHQLGQDASNAAHNPMRTAGQVGTGLLAAELGGKALSAAGEAGSAIRNAAIGDPDAAAVRGLKVPANSPKMQRTVSSVQNARPYLQGVESQADLQARIPQAKAEVWGPYQQAIDANPHMQVKGPDGPTTLKNLEDERLQLSALNRGLKSRDPEAVQLAQQKGMSQADLLARESAVKAHLDPALEQLGLKPGEIRKTFGSIAQIGSKVSGKSNIIEPQQPYGFSKLKDISITKPLSNIPTILGAGRDIAAGRYMSASPIDTGIREGFRNAGPKPDLGTYQPPAIRGQIGPGAIRMGAPPEMHGPPEGYQPPPFYHDTDAMRTGRLLNAPPIQLGGTVENRPTSTFRYDTTPMRKGNILPPGVSDDMPLSSHADIFPNQIPQATKIRPKILEGKK